MTMKQLFEIGQVVTTPAALEALQRNKHSVLDLLNRHKCGDWGNISRADAQANEAAIKDGSRILSSYTLTDSTVIWIITEAIGDFGRASSCVLLPDEY